MTSLGRVATARRRRVAQITRVDCRSWRALPFALRSFAVYLFLFVDKKFTSPASHKDYLMLVQVFWLVFALVVEIQIYFGILRYLRTYHW